MGALSGAAAIVVLLAISFCSFLLGSIFRKWPDKVQEYVEPIDGSIHLLSPKAHRATTQAAGIALSLLSVVALIAAAVTL